MWTAAGAPHGPPDLPAVGAVDAPCFGSTVPPPDADELRALTRAGLLLSDSDTSTRGAITSDAGAALWVVLAIIGIVLFLLVIVNPLGDALSF